MLATLLICACSFGSPILKPQLDYRLTVDSADLSGVRVELRIRNAPAGVTLAAPAHPEYDDRYWRYLEELEVSGPGGERLVVTRADSVLWQVENPAGDVLVRYRVRFPRENLPRAAWRPFLTPTGGLIGGPHSFLYVLGQERAPTTLVVDIPRTWSIGTALATAGPNTFSAPDLHSLMESPLQIGRQSVWTFSIRGVPHRVFYWRLPDAQPFDTTAFVRGIEQTSQGAVSLFGSMPYREYTFLYQDGAYGGLEHPASVTLGAPSATLASDPHALLPETAHEFFHTWNLMWFKPAEYRGLEYRTQPPVAGLWFSEGLTLFYADLLIRRAGLARPSQPTRLAHLEMLLSRYWGSPGNSRFSAEAISRVAYNAGPGALGDYQAGVHLVGEILGAMLDFAIRDATGGRRSMDDVMRLMNARFGGKGFVGADVRRIVEEVCRCGGEIFDRHVLAGNPVDFDRYLGPVGLRTVLSWAPARDSNGEPSRDLRIFGYNRPGEDSLRIVISDPGSIWGRAGLHSHDVLLAVNGAPVRTWPELRSRIAPMALGDTVRMTVVQQGRERTAIVVLSGFDRPVVRIEPVPGATERARTLREAWEQGR